MTLAFLFPGQGSQAVGMGKALAVAFPAARAAFATADRVLGVPLTTLAWEGPEDELRQTRNAQPALLVHSVAALRVLEERGLRPDVVAGHSLGEYSACVAAGALAYEDALRLVRTRGELMHRAGTDQPGTMAAVLGLDEAKVEEACAKASGGGEVAVAANFNAPGQIVISGHLGAVARAGEIAKSLGARRVVPLPVSAAFHSPLMASAARALAEAIDATPVARPRCPIVSNVRAEKVETAEAVRAALKDQLLGAVRWQSSMRLLLDTGVDHFVEIGTGRVLRGLLKSLDPAALSFSFGEPGELEATLGGLGRAGQPAAGAGA